MQLCPCLLKFKSISAFLWSLPWVKGTGTETSTTWSAQDLVAVTMRWIIPCWYFHLWGLSRGFYNQSRLDTCTRTAGISWNESCPGIQWTAKTERWLSGMASWEAGEGLRGQTWKKGSASIQSEGGHQGVVWEQKCGYVRKTEKSQCSNGTQLGEILRQSGRGFWSGQEKIVTRDVCSKAILCLFRHKWQREMQRSKFRACIKKKSYQFSLIVS